MPKFLVLFLAPPEVIDDWKKTDPAVREPAEAKMRTEWNAWMAAHAGIVGGTEAAGRTMRVTADGVEDARNEVMLICSVEAPSLSEAAAVFADHPHLTIPRSAIEVMETRPMSGA